MNILVTGASDFVGHALCERLSSMDHQVTGIVPSQASSQAGENSQINFVTLPDVMRITSEMLQGIDIVFHVDETSDQNHPERELHRVNVIGSKKLGLACIEAGVSRLIYLSSTMAVGEGSIGPDDIPEPATPFGVSKHRAELELLDLGSSSKLAVVSVRVPLTYGPGVQGYFNRLARLSVTRLPLPLSALEARRSYLGLENLLDFLILSITSDEVVGRCFFVTDPEAISLGDLLELLGKAQGKKIRKVNLSVSFVNRAARFFLPRIDQLMLSPGEVDLSETRELTHWQPNYSTMDCVQQMFGQLKEA